MAGADLTGADLSNVQRMDTQLVNTKYNPKTVFPDGFDPRKAGMRMGD